MLLRNSLKNGGNEEQKKVLDRRWTETKSKFQSEIFQINSKYSVYLKQNLKKKLFGYLFNKIGNFEWESYDKNSSFFIFSHSNQELTSLSTV